MSFLSVLGTIGKDAVAVANVASPLANFFIPGAGSALQAITSLVIQAEQHPALQGSGTGAQKKAWVLDTIQLGLPFFQQILKAHGELLELDGQALANTIDSTVSLFNALAKLHSSFQLTKIQGA